MLVRFSFFRCFWGFVLPVLEYCSAVWCSAADTRLKLLDHVVSGPCFLAGGMLNCNLSHRRSVAVLVILTETGADCFKNFKTFFSII